MGHIINNVMMSKGSVVCYHEEVFYVIVLFCVLLTDLDSGNKVEWMNQA